MFPLLTSVLDFPLVLNPTSTRPCHSVSPPFPLFIVNDNSGPGNAADDPSKLVKVVASHGKTGEQCELRYGPSRGRIRRGS